MIINDIISYLEEIAPPSLQESYDNAGLITGDRNWKVKKAIICLDSTEAVIDEAIANNCNLVIAHHPIVFKGLKRFNGSNYVERVIIKAIKNDIAIYAIHTNLDNVFTNGVNSMVAETLGLTNTRILAPKAGLERAVVYCPVRMADSLKKGLLKVSNISGAKGYDYSGLGVSTEGAKAKVDFQYPVNQRGTVEKLIKSFDEEISYDLIPLSNKNSHVGSGLIGEMKKPMAERAFLAVIQKEMSAPVIRHTKLRNRPVKKVAVCGGSGSFLLNQAKAAGADVFITSDFKYHEFFDAEKGLVIADIGHYETEQYTIELLQRIISEKFSNFAAYCTGVNTNPVYYF